MCFENSLMFPALLMLLSSLCICLPVEEHWDGVSGTDSVITELQTANSLVQFSNDLSSNDTSSSLFDFPDGSTLPSCIVRKFVVGAIGIAVVVLFVCIIAVVACCLGFTPRGITSGSFGASAMSVSWTTGYCQCLVSRCQSIGATGIVCAPALLIPFALLVGVASSFLVGCPISDY